MKFSVCYVLQALCVRALFITSVRATVIPSTTSPAVDDRQSCRCVPDQWEGVLTSIERDFNMNIGTSETLENSIRVHYDLNNERFAMTDLASGKKVIENYRQRRKLIIGEHGCVELPVGGENMRRMCLPEHAEYLGQYTLGTDMAVGMWQLAGPHNITTRTTVLQSNCVPITEEVYISNNGYASLTNSMYLDVSLGIQDVQVFAAPANCVPAAENYEYEAPPPGSEGSPVNQPAVKRSAVSYSEAILSQMNE